MNAMTNFTLKSLRANKVRTLVTVAGVALAAALLTAVLTTYTSLTDMLYRGEASYAGSWMAQVEVEDPTELEASLSAGTADGDISDYAVLQDVGFGELTAQQENIYGIYLPIANLSGNVEELCAIKPSEGRMPEAPGEIMLCTLWRDSDDAVQLGDTLTVKVGDRQAVLAPGREGSMSMGTVSAGIDYVPEDEEQEIVDGTLLNSSMGYLQAAESAGLFNEELTNTREMTFTVVGFYERNSYASVTSLGLFGFTCGEPTDGTSFAYITMDGVSDSQQVRERAEAAFPDCPVTLHTAMLRYLGINTGGGIWDTFYGIVVILAVVIVAACISLIYNAFAISVAERTGQFGLLASVGATRRQLRRAVVIEGLAIALVGIPLGLIVGLLGCLVTFTLLGPDIAYLFGGSSEIGFRLAVDPAVLIVTSVLTLITVMFSVFIPAWRAGRTNIIESLRGQQGKRASKRGASRAARATNPAKLWKNKGVAGRVFGIGGTIARINKKRGTSRGTAASVSLALAIVLLLTAGSLSSFLGVLVDVAGGGEPAGDIGIAAALMTDEQAEENDAYYNGTPINTSDEPVTLQEVVDSANETFAAEATIFSDCYAAMSQVPDATAVGWKMSGNAPITVDPSMVSKKFANHEIEGLGTGGMTEDGQFAAYASFVYLDDASFDEFARAQGLDPDYFRDADHPRVIALQQAYGNDGNKYQLLDVFTETGMADVTVGGVYEGRAINAFSVSYIQDGPDEPAVFSITPYFYNYLDDDDTAFDEDVVAAEGEFATQQIEIAAIATEGPALASGDGAEVQLFLPVSMAQHHSFGIQGPVFRSVFNAPEGQSPELSQELVDRGGDFLHEVEGFQTSFYYMNDYVTEVSQNRILATVVNVFCLLFTIILALIALANVFNTVTNGLILRRREFAVMRSIGLSNRQFRRMIVDECASWCIRGLIPGAVLSLGVAYLLYVQVGYSLGGLEFHLPWIYIGLAAALTAFAIIISVAYGMHRCKADNLVEALRTDNV